MRMMWIALAGLVLAGCGKKKNDDGPGSSAGSGSGSGAPARGGLKASLGGAKGSGAFDPSAQGFKFENYGNEGVENLTPAEVHRMFGDDACAYVEDKDCVLTPAAEQWMEETNKGMDGGHCEGLAALSLLFRLGKLAPKDFGGDKVHDLELTGNAKLQHEVAYWFATQGIAPMSTAEVRLTPNEIVDKLAASFDKNDESWTLGLYMPDGSLGHATTPYAIVERDDGETWIMHYDSNFPGEARHIAVDRKTNTWKYFTASDPKAPGALYEGDTTTKSLTISPTSVRTGKLVCPFCGDVDGDEGGAARGMRQITLDGDADLLITDETGKRIGHANGKLVNEIAGAKLVEMKTAKKGGRDHEPMYYLPANKKLVATIDGSTLKKQEQTDVSLIAPGYTLGVYGIELAPGAKDTVAFSADWHEISYTTQSPETPDLEIGIETKAADYELEVNAAAETDGISIDMSVDVAAGTFTVAATAKDGKAEYEVEIRRFSAAGHKQTFKHHGVSAGPKDRFTFHYKDWKGDHDKVHVDVDHDGDGKNDEVEDLGDED